MALKVMSMTDLRLEVLREASLGFDSVSEICKRFGISRETFYVYQRRFAAEGVEGLEPRSRQPIHQPRRMSEEMETEICDMRKDQPKWGARRIRTELRRKGLDPPAISSIHQALVRNNLVAPGRVRPRPATTRFERAAPNELWQIDATRLELADSSEVWAMDLLDDHARFCLAIQANARATGEAAVAAFEWAVARYGVPTAVLSDNGLCFTGRLKGVEVAFERELHALGVTLLHARPYHPQTCGKLERFHRTMKEWLAQRPLAQTIEELQALLEEFRAHYNEDRPNQGIDDMTPAERYSASPHAAVPVSPIAPPQNYPKGSLIRKVSRCGNLSFKGHLIRVGPQWYNASLRVVVIDGIVHLYDGERLVRALRFSPGIKYYGALNTPNRTNGKRRGAKT